MNSEDHAILERIKDQSRGYKKAKDEGMSNDILVAEARLGALLISAWEEGKLLFIGETDTYTHKKRGSRYRHIHTGNVQAATRPLEEGDKAFVYQDDDGSVWIRRDAEFLDGRFALEADFPSE